MPVEPAVLASDSAGVTIVENYRPELDGSAVWRLAEEPALQIGPVDDADQSFNRVAAARTLSSGRIAVCDAGDHQIRVFAPDGALLRSLGREGEGPGEFQACGTIDVLAGDTLLVFDAFLGRITVFDSVGGLVTTLRLQPPDASGGFFYLVRLADASYLTLGGTNPMYLGEGSGLLRGAGWVSHLDAEGKSLGKILEFRTGEGLVLPEGRGYMSTPFARRHFTAPGKDELVLGFADQFHFEIYDFDGRLKRIVRRVGEPVPVTGQDIAIERERARTSSSQFRRDHADDLAFPETHPAYDDLLTDLEGNVWIQGRPRRDTEGAHRWSVFDRDGRWVSDVLVPDDLHIMEIGGDYMLAIWRDELNVQFLRRYELYK